VLSEKSKQLRLWLTKTLKNAPPASIQQARAIVEFGASRAVLPAGTRVEPVTAASVQAEWVRAENVATDRVIMYLHGGGFSKCSCNTARMTVAQISAATGCSVLSVEYRLAPENPFPAALEDALAAYRWLLEQGFATEKLVLMGDSSGGGLAVSTLVSLVADGDRLPCGAVLLSPWVDLTCGGESVTSRAEVDPWMTEQECRACAEMYAPGGELSNPLISPLYADLKGLPPLLIHVGTDEILLDDSRRLAEKAREAGVDVTLHEREGMWHVWHYFAPHLPEAVEAIGQVGDYVRGRMEK
jgi:acetyl esterase/lipase